jgi:peroxiredoxin Q/BCP
VHFAASVDAAEENRRFAESLEVDYPILSDPGKQVATSYGVVTPERGTASRWTFYIGVDGKILFIDKNVHTQTAGPDIAAKLAELGVARKR